MNRTSLAMVIPLVLLVVMVTTPRMITEDAFAIYQRHTGASNLNQAASITNSCLNPVSNSNTNDNMISNGNCGGTISQQGKSGQSSSPTTVQNANPNIEVQRSTTAQSPGLGSGNGDCIQCFTNNTGFMEHASDFLEVVKNDPIWTGVNEGNPITSLNQLCDLIATQPETAIGEIPGNLINAGIAMSDVNAIVLCLF